MNIKWTENEKNYIKDNAHCMKDIEISKALTEMSGRKVTLQSCQENASEAWCEKEMR